MSAQYKLQTVSRSSCSHDSCDHPCFICGLSCLTNMAPWWATRNRRNGSDMRPLVYSGRVPGGLLKQAWWCVQHHAFNSLFKNSIMKLWPRVEENCHCLQDVGQYGPHGCQVHLKLKMWRLMMGCRHQACRIGATGTVSVMKKGGGFQNSKCCWRLETYRTWTERSNSFQSNKY